MDMGVSSQANKADPRLPQLQDSLSPSPLGQQLLQFMDEAKLHVQHE